MNEHDAEIERLKAGVSCAVLLERLPPPWRLDRGQSTRHSLKYRRGEGEILIVNHDGRGWWDPLSDRKGDIFTLVQHLDRGLSFSAARCVLRDFVGIAPTFPEAVHTRRRRASSVSVAQRWDRCQPLSRGSPAWRYLTGQRRLPDSILLAARAADAIREGPHGSAWFAHRGGAGCLTGIEMRGSEYRNFSAGGGKTLYRAVLRRWAFRPSLTARRQDTPCKLLHCSDAARFAHEVTARMTDRLTRRKRSKCGRH